MAVTPTQERVLRMCHDCKAQFIGVVRATTCRRCITTRAERVGRAVADAVDRRQDEIELPRVPLPPALLSSAQRYRQDMSTMAMARLRDGLMATPPSEQRTTTRIMPDHARTVPPSTTPDVLTRPKRNIKLDK